MVDNTLTLWWYVRSTSCPISETSSSLCIQLQEMSIDLEVILPERGDLYQEVMHLIVKSCIW